MLLNGYRKEIFRAKCNPSFQSVHCIAHLDEDIAEVIPYLNATLGGDIFTRQPPSVTFRAHGKLITVHPREIAVNALQDEEEADRILAWMQREINEAWDKRGEITPRFTGREKPRVFILLKALPKTNCGDCGCPTCMVFAVHLAEGAKGPENCPFLSGEERDRLGTYLSRFDPDA